MARLHLGLILPNYGDALDAERLAVAAVTAEEAGFDSGWVTDHVLVPPEHASVYGTIAESLVVLGFLAGRTQTLELGVSALVVPQRNPLVALKQLTTLDFLSGGRVVTAVAAGWMEGEFATLGASFEERGRLLDEWLDAAAAVFDQMPGLVRWDGKLLLSFEGWLAPAWDVHAAARLPDYAERRRPACGTRSRCRPTSCARWRRSCGSADRTRVSSCASASRSRPSPIRDGTSEAATRSPARRNGSRSGSRSTPTPAATASW